MQPGTRYEGVECQASAPYPTPVTHLSVKCTPRWVVGWLVGSRGCSPWHIMGVRSCFPHSPRIILKVRAPLANVTRQCTRAFLTRSYVIDLMCAMGIFILLRFQYFYRRFIRNCTINKIVADFNRECEMRTALIIITKPRYEIFVSPFVVDYFVADYLDLFISQSEMNPIVVLILFVKFQTKSASASN